ncbi:MAG: tetratricopeptide repeat protein [Methanomicrobiales archaeon]|nr:tetratricopeptide repeat protein [Methanomicrobiales archaeon]
MHSGSKQRSGQPVILCGIIIGFLLLTAFISGCTSEQKGNVKYIQDGIDQYNAGNFKDALWSFERYLIDDENSTTAGFAWGWKGITYEELGKYDQALTCIDRAIQITPDDPVLWKARQRILLQLGRPDEAAWAEQKAASLQNPSASPLPTFTTLPPSPTPTLSPFTERDRTYVTLARNQTARLSELSLQASTLAPSEYQAHGSLFSSTTNRFSLEVERAKPDDLLLIQSWRQYQDALRRFSKAGAYEEQAGKDFAANNFTGMSTSLQDTVLCMEEGNTALTLTMELIDQSGFSE